MPLQMSWAAVAAYCGHEAPVDAAHFGHHDHQHTSADLAEAGTDDAQADKAPGAPDLDCSHCHGSCSAVMHLPHGLPGALPAARPDAGACSHAQTRPDRPQWPRLA